ncbi:MAG: PEP-CTERM sorting domain-containing protein [Kiritimatiellales bacterium]|nr:PEP-CTERM sorting domain-containing protein [Kiritimatiellales bacterium]
MLKEKKNMINYIVRHAISLTIIASLSYAAHATPIMLDKPQFLTATNGLATVIEDFEAFDVGLIGTPFPPAPTITLANASYTSIQPQIRLDSPNNPTKTLFENGPDLESGRVFHSFLPNTTLFGTDLNDIDSNSGILDINVVGVSGTANFQASFATLDSFFGVSDPLGLISVSFINRGVWAWGLDNVITASAIPEPTTVSLLGLGAMVAIISKRQRRKRDTTKLPKPKSMS